VYAVPFDITDNRPQELYRAIFERSSDKGWSTSATW
jgi:hypothetical protein